MNIENCPNILIVDKSAVIIVKYFIVVDVQVY